MQWCDQSLRSGDSTPANQVFYSDWDDKNKSYQIWYKISLNWYYITDVKIVSKIIKK